MTPEEASILSSVGHGSIQIFASIVNKTIWLTIYAFLVIKASILLLSKPRRHSRVSQFITSSILVMFTIACIMWAIDCANFIMKAKIMLIEADPNVALDSQLQRASAFIFRLAVIESALYGYLSILGDAIIILRLIVLWGHNRHRWVLVIPCALLLGSLVSNLTLTYCVAKLGTEIALGTFEKPAFCRNVQTTTYRMAAGTTVIATILIGVLTWNYRHSFKVRTRKDERGVRRKRSPAENVLVLLIESGILYCLFFVIQVIGTIPSIQAWIATQSGVSFAINMFSWCTSVFVGIYPTAVVVLAHSRYAILDSAASANSDCCFTDAAPQAMMTTWTMSSQGSTHIDLDSSSGRRDDCELQSMK
ncbi:hypothetical protein C8J56DRAFT_1038236 [Mycena floridula]|nr:hypothetical protein C8J56DRAFT_1038236 [Mycena floridula]